MSTPSVWTEREPTKPGDYVVKRPYEWAKEEPWSLVEFKPWVDGPPMLLWENTNRHGGKWVIGQGEFVDGTKFRVVAIDADSD